MKKIFAMLLAASMLLSLTACGGSGDSSDTTSEQQTTSASDKESESQLDSSTVIEEVYEGNMYDVNEMYQAILAEQPEDMEPLQLFDESKNKDLIKNNYPNFYNCDYEQILYYAPPIAGYPCEIMIVQTKTEREADYIEDEFIERIEMGASDVDYPENAYGWAYYAEVQRDGNFVVMIVLPEGYEIPYVFGLM